MTLKNKENIETLVRGIIRKDDSMIYVKDSALIPYYVHNSKYMVEVEPEDKTDLRWNYSYDFDGLKKKYLERAKKLGANYIFVSNFYHESKLLGVITPFMIISENEENFLLKNFYKDVPEEVSKAASELGIMLLDRDYSSYLKGKLNETYYNTEEYTQYIQFLNFVFSLPYDEQNIETNKKIIKYGYPQFDNADILTKEYSNGEHFKEYFEQLQGIKDKQKVVERIKTLERNRDNDVYLLKKGFVMGEDSAIELSKKDAKAFMGYFEKLGQESKKILIEKIYEEPAINQEVVAWLEENCTPLLREVGFSGGKQNGN